MDIDTLIERQEVLVENQKQLLSAMVSTLDLMKAEKLRQEIDQEIAFDEPNKTVEQEEDPRIQKHKINALKKGYTPEEAEKIASICRSYYKSIDKMQAELSEKSMKIHEIFNEQSVKKGSWQQKYLTDFDKYVSKCRYCLNSGLNLPDEPMLKDYDPALIAERQKIEEELKQEAAAAGMTVEEYAANDFISPKQQTTNKKATKKQPTL